jgi:hypothetical protein
MRLRIAPILGALAMSAVHLACAESGSLGLLKSVIAGEAFSIQSTGSGQATLYIVGTAQVIKRDVHLGELTYFPAGSLYNAGHYLALLRAGASTDSGTFDVVPASKPGSLSFLAKPSRLQIGLHDGISGAIYAFDSYDNLITVPTPVSFELSNPSGNVQTRAVTSSDGAASVEMDSTAQQGVDKFVARIDGASSVRVIRQVPGDPCALKMSVTRSGKQLQLVTDPVRDCSGNAVPDGTIVTFAENYGGSQSTVDVPLKRGIATVEMPAHEGATISVASGVVLGNQIRWEK